jgi:Ca2+-binding EF-hand superfamily protein
MNTSLLGGAVAAAIVAMAPAAAQTPAPAPAAPQVQVRILQSDGQGWTSVQTRAEVAAHVRKLFDRLDTNHDGSITKAEAEAAKGNWKVMRMHAPGGGGGVGGKPADRGAMFDRLDTNHDSTISRDEFARAPTREERRIVIANGGPGEIQGMRHMRMGMGGFGGRMFDLADANHDGRVTLQEATDAALRHFDTADVNRDGKLTPEERMQMHQRMHSERRPG